MTIRRISITLLVLCAFFMLVYPDFVFTQEIEKTYIIGLKKNSDEARFIKTNGIDGKKHKKIKKFNMMVVNLTPNEVSKLKKKSEVDYIETDAKVSITTTEEVYQDVNDYDFLVDTQMTPWGVEDIGGLKAVQNQVYGSGIKIAVLDTGINNHPDINVAGGVYFNDGVTSYVDDNGHGTHVAGIIAAANNGVGVVGVAPNAQLYAVKVLDKDGTGTYSQVIQGIDWAIQNGVNIISIGFGGSEDSQALRQAIQEATNRGILVVAPAGNSGMGDNTMVYPAQYPEVISVGAVNRLHQRASFSSTGVELDLVAPGVDILSTTFDGKYGVMSGTSMAAPHVVGTAASLWSQNASWTAEQVKQHLYSTAVPLGNENEYGRGIVALDKGLGLNAIGFDIVEEDQKILELSKSVLYLIKRARDVNNMPLANEIEEQYNLLQQRNTSVHMLPDSLSPKNTDTVAINTYFNGYENDIRLLEEDYKKLLSKYISYVPSSSPIPVDKVTVMSYNFQGDCQTIMPGSSASVSLQLYEAKTTIKIRVLDARTWNTITSTTRYNVAAKATVPFTWYSSSSTPEGPYLIEYSYPGVPDASPEYFNIYVRNYTTISLNNPIDIVSPEIGWFHVFKFTPSTSGSYILATSPRGGTGPNNDTYLELFSDSKLLNRIKSDDDSAGNGFSKITRNLSAGVTYYIKLSAISNNDNYMVNARLSVTQPINVETIYFNSPIDVDLSVGQSRVYKFTAPNSGSYRIFTGPYNNTGAMNDTYLELYTDSGLTNRIDQNDDIGGSNYFSEINYNLTGGITYYIKLRHYSSSEAVHARLTIGSSVAQINLNTPIDINIASGSSKVYKFTPSATNTYRIRTGFYGGNCNSGDSDTVLYLFSDANLTNRIDRNDDANGTLFSEINCRLSAGSSYYIKVEGYEGDAVLARLLIDIKPSTPPSTPQPISGTDAAPAIHTADPSQKDDLSFQLEPVDLSTGAQVIEKSLLKVQGADTLSFDVRYDSLALNQGPLGRGWVHNFEICLKIQQSGEVLVYWNSNRINTYAYSGNNQYTSNEQAAKFDLLVRNSDGSFVLTRKNQSSYRFNPAGQLIEQKNGHGQSFVMTYDSTGHLSTVTELISRRFLNLTYNSNGLITKVNDNLNRQVIIEYDANRNLTKITDAKAQSNSFIYDANGWMLSFTDAENIRIFSNTYDTKGRVVQQIDALSNTSSLSYDEASQPGKLITVATDRNGNSQVLTHDTNYRLLNVRDQLGNLTSYTYDADGNKTSMTDAYGKTNNFTYDTKGNLLTATDPVGHTTTMTYDNRNNLLSVKNPANKTITYSYDANNNVTRITDQMGNIITNNYDVNGLLLNTTKPGTGQAIYSYVYGQIQTLKVDGVLKSTMNYDAVGRLISKSDNRGKTTSMSYDTADNLLTITDPLGNTVSYSYDKNDLKISETDAKGNSSRYAYDGNGKLISITDPLNNIIRYEYDKEGRLVRTLDPKGNNIILTYDAKGRLTSTTDQNGNTVANYYDAVDRIIKKTDALGNVIENITYDALGNPISVTDAVYSSVYNHYDILNRLDKITDPLGRNIFLTYDDLNRLINVTDKIGGQSKQNFDVDGNKTNTTDPNNYQTLFNYDKAGRLVSKTLVAGNNISYTYDGADLMLQMTNGRGQATTYQYDDKGRILSFTDPTGTVSYSYDANGNIVTVSDSNGTITRQYDALNRLIKYTDARGNIIQYNYDQTGNLTELTYPDGKKVLYGYDKANRLTSVTDWANRVTSYEYDSNSRLVKTTRPNGSILVSKYDAAGRLTQQKDTDRTGVTIAQYDFSYDALGNVVEEQSSIQEQTLEIPDTVMTYTYDNRLDTFNGQGVLYDKDGNMTFGPLSGTMSDYTYDSRNRLTAAGNMTYLYDAENNRIGVSETVDGSVYQTNFVVNPQASLSQVLIKTDAQGKQTFYIYGLGLIGQEEDNNYKSYHFDSRGSTIAMTDYNGNVTDNFQYGPSGELVFETETSHTPFLYNGRDGIMTDNNGLYYMRARYYNPEAKRFVNQDVILGSIDNGQGLNRYAYVKGNPISNVDPSGLYTVAIGGGTQLGAGLGFNGSVQVAFDGHGNWILLGTIGGGIATPSAGAGGGITITNADNVHKLTKWGYQVGGSLGPITVEKVGVRDDWYGYSVSGGENLPIIPAEGHGSLTYTWDLGSVSAEDREKYYKEIQSKIKELNSSLPNEVKQKLNDLAGKKIFTVEKKRQKCGKK